jgi:hypothetical protein
MNAGFYRLPGIAGNVDTAHLRVVFIKHDLDSCILSSVFQPGPPQSPASQVRGLDNGMVLPYYWDILPLSYQESIGRQNLYYATRGALEHGGAGSDWT